MELKHRQLSPLVVDKIVNDVINQSIMQSKAKQRLSTGSSQSQKVYGMFMGNFFKEIAYNTTLTADTEKVPVQKQTVLLTVDEEPLQLQQELAAKMEIKYVELQPRPSSKTSLKSINTLKTRMRLSNNKINSPSLQKREVPQRKKFFSEQNKKSQKKLIKLKLDQSNKEDEKMQHISKLQGEMRSIRIAHQIINKGNLFAVKKLHSKKKKSQSLPATDFPLIENINTVTYSINNQKKKTMKKTKKQFSPINSKNAMTKQTNVEYRSRLQLQRQNESKSYFQNFHLECPTNQMRQEEILLKEMDKIRMVDQIKVNVVLKSKEKRQLDKNIIQAQRKSLTLLGGRQRRCSKISGTQNLLVGQANLPQIKTYLKLQSRGKENCNRPSRFTEVNKGPQKIKINNRSSLNMLLMQDKASFTRLSEFQEGPHSAQVKNMIRSQNRESIFKSYSISQIGFLQQMKREIPNEESQISQTTTEPIDGLSSIHLDSDSRIMVKDEKRCLG